jgi:hypothetical protein
MIKKRAAYEKYRFNTSTQALFIRRLSARTLGNVISVPSPYRMGRFQKKLVGFFIFIINRILVAEVYSRIDYLGNVVWHVVESTIDENNQEPTGNKPVPM